MSQKLVAIHSLTELNLASSKFGGAGLLVLSDALKQNSLLKSLDLSNNSIQFAGLPSLGEALILNSSIKSLKLRYNKIEESGAEKLAQAFPFNSSLTELDLSRNNIPAKSPALKSIEEALKRNKTRSSNPTQSPPGPHLTARPTRRAKGKEKLYPKTGGK